ncbi:hypothetical protein Hamer_G000659 [Homarus americanus]|uniref:Uncharacterized protein n=1 Tax=Homarus americanus TaxID=6706 RepID=A0A8J5TUI7_HOMAM|nr:hypothetical protein Hamer_G000659 [Homarus americanus]
MASRFAHESLFAFLLAEEEDAVESARDALNYHKLSKREPFARPTKRQKMSQVDPVQRFDGGQIIIKTEEPESKKRKK